jgi:hypothetical protein
MHAVHGHAGVTRGLSWRIAIKQIGGAHWISVVKGNAKMVIIWLACTRTSATLYTALRWDTAVQSGMPVGILVIRRIGTTRSNRTTHGQRFRKTTSSHLWVAVA